MKKLTTALGLILWISQTIYTQTLPSPQTMPPCPSNTCNIICDGNFENATDPRIYSYHNLVTAFSNSPDLFRKVGSVLYRGGYDWSNLSVVNLPVVSTSGCGFNQSITAPEGNNYIGITCHFLLPNPAKESIAFRLRRTLIQNQSYTIKFWARKSQSNCSSFDIGVYGSTMAPCGHTQLTKIDGTVSSCGYTAIKETQIAINSDVWTEYTYTFNAQSAYNYLLVTFPNIPTGGIYYYGYFDDFRLFENNPISAVATVNCSNITLNVSGGTAPYTYLWSDGATSKNRTGLIASNYSVIIEDVYGCSTSQSATIAPPTTTTTFAMSNVNCNGNIADITATTTGGIAPYSYQWSSGSTTNPTSLTMGNTYLLTVTDATNCSSVSSYVVPVNTASNLDITLNTTVASCSSSGATITSYVTGGSGPYTYAWNNGTTLINLVNGTPGNLYTVTVTDAKGCSKSASDFAGYIPIGQGTLYPNATTLSSKYSTSIPYRKFRIIGDFESDITMVFSHCDFYANAGTRFYTPYKPVDLSIDQCNFSACGTQLWKGLEIYSYMTKLSVINSTLEDALMGIYINKAWYLTLSNNTFKNNWVGLYLWGGQYIDIHSNQFLGSSTLKTIYPGYVSNDVYPLNPPNISFYNKSWAGIYYDGTGGIYIGSTASGAKKNVFKDMYNGVLTNLMFSPTTIVNSEFQNMTANSSILAAGRPSGNGVFGGLNSPIGASTLISITGLGTNLTDPPTFTNCDIAVNFLDGNMNVQNSKMTGVKSGIKYTSSKFILDKFNVSNNIINASEYGIDASFRYLGLNSTGVNNISGNTINLTGSSPNHTGILVSDITKPKTSYNKAIVSNIVNTFGTTGYGIAINSMDNVYSTNNLVKLNSPTNSLGGIQFNTCKTLKQFQDNVSTASSIGRTLSNTSQTPADHFPVGIYYNFSEGIYRCNQVKDIRMGERFTGVCAQSSIEKNKFNNHFIGLKVDNTASLDVQSNKGNTWLGSYLGGSGAQNAQVPMTTFFKVGSPLIKFWPTPRTTNFFNSWGSGDDDNCVGQIPPAARIPLVLKAQILAGQLSFSDYQPSLVYQNELSLYQELNAVRDTILIGSPEYNFLLAHDTTPMADYLNLSESANEIYNFPEVKQAQIDAWQSVISETESTIDSLTTVLISVDDSLKPTVEAELNRVKNYLPLIQVEMQNFIDSFREDVSDHFDSLSLVNAMTQPTEMTEVLQQKFNQVYYETYAIGESELTPIQVNQYRYLASQCPLFNADVVYRSRAVMRLYDDTTFFDDALICEAVGLQYRSAQNKKPIDLPKSLQCILYPNPTKDFANFLFSEIPQGEIQIVISDIQGRVVSINKISNLNFNIYRIPISQFESGIYYVSVFENKMKILSTKLSIQKND